MTAAFASLSISNHPASDRRILSLFFPRLPTDRIARRRWGLSWRLPPGSTVHPEYPPLACAGRVANAMRITALDETAETFGLRVGQGLAEARAICASLDVIEADPAADRALLDAVADWCDRYTPLVALDGDDGLMLDITGCAHLFGGEDRLVEDVDRRLTAFGFAVHIAVGPTPGLARACSRFGGPRCIAASEATAALAPLPVAALRLEPQTVMDLARVGLKTVSELLAAPRPPITRRFGQAPMLRLDQALGREGEPISPRRHLPLLSAERRLAEPIMTEDQVLDLAGRLAGGLKTSLEARGEGGRLFELLVFRVDGRVFRIEVGASAPLRDTARIRALFEERLSVLHDDLDAGFGFELVRLNVLLSETYDARQPELVGEEDNREDLTRFLDQISARLGERALRLPVPLASHWPERATMHAPATDALKALDRPAARTDVVARPVRGLRPLRLLDRPEEVEVMSAVPDGPPASFRWRRVQRRILRAEGPERLAPEWWVDGEDAPPRDYFRIEDTDGQRFWLYRQGLYERRTVTPTWFLQGFFA
ncbi:DNA polymerase Y family protein [Rhizobium rhizophilum]|uniref:DNA polymerase Y family protein n=2 Tax=Rhizobium rhizophilum TaxID=1850373 RepID=A0ABY2QQ11_9HYPH|nr:DNA polymerase Y family protein [Rhizobium rhizophilum]